MLRAAIPLAAALAALGLAVACRSGEPGAHRTRPLPALDGAPALRVAGPARSPRLASYVIGARLDVEQHRITATQTLTWTNAGATPVDVLPFHLYLNGFKNESSLFMRSSGGDFRGESMDDDGWGWIQIDSIKVAGGPELRSTLRAPANAAGDETVVELPLPVPVAAGGTVTVDLRFTAQLPAALSRTGYEGELHLVAQWFPKVGVRVGPPGAERWECRAFHANAEFFADFGTYDVTLTVPATFVVAATGVLVAAAEAAGGTRTYTYRAEDVHDFAWLADPYMETLTGEAIVEGAPVVVRVLHRAPQRAFAQRHLAAAIGTIETMSKLFVPYPWRTMTVVDPPPEAAATLGGMEYPTFVTTAGDTVLAREGLRMPEYVTVHEVGHNWFQGILASNEGLEAWLDEGLNEWANAKVMASLYSPRASAIDWMGWQADLFELRRALAEAPASLPSPIATAAAAMADDNTYTEQTYTATLLALRTLELTVGASRFEAAMRAYATTFAFKHPTGSDLFATLSRELGQDLAWFFGPVFHGVGSAAHTLRSASCSTKHPLRGVFGDGSARTTVTAAQAPDAGTFVCEVIVTNTGTVHVPVDIELTFRDGSTQRVRWDDRGHGAWERFVVERSSKLAEVMIDPDGKLALAPLPGLQHRLVGQGGASLRAGAWVASGTQTLMQILGL